MANPSPPAKTFSSSTPSPSKMPAATAVSPVQQQDIGGVAGDIWRYLYDNGESSTLKIRAELKVPHSLFFLALGWLAREDKVRVFQTDKGFRAALK